MKIKKQKPLLPTLKERKRYLVYEAITKAPITQAKTHSLIKASLKDLTGTLGLSKAGLIFLKDWNKQRGIVRINNKELDHLKSSLVQIREKNILFRSIGVSGMLKQARRKMEDLQ
jgi:ribonuclease P/MRP protein subunit POP5